MGVTFRSGEYVRFVRMGGRTIKDGEATVVWNNRGVATQIIGPQRVGLWWSTIRFLTHFKAGANQYLVVEHCNGRVEHMNGPFGMYLNPVVHSSIEVKDATILASKEDCIVVFSPVQKTSEHAVSEKVEWSNLRVIYGPTIHFPSPGEAVHNFMWHEPARTLNFPGCSQGQEGFKVLHLMKTRFWAVSLTVKTSESHHVSVTLGISYCVESVEKCLSTQDPIQLIEAALLHDAQNCAGGTEDNIAEWIVKESTFPTFCETMASVGFRLVKIQVLNVAPSLAVVRRKRVAQTMDPSKMDQEVKAATQINEVKLNYLKGLQELGVDVTQVLVAQGGRVEWDDTTSRNKAEDAKTSRTRPAID